MTDMRDIMDVKQCMTDSNEAQPTWGGSNDAQQTQMKHNQHMGC